MKFFIIPVVFAIASTLLIASPVGIRAPPGLTAAPANAIGFPESPAFAVGLPLEVVPDSILQQCGNNLTSETSGSGCIFKPANLQGKWNTVCETTSGSPLSWHVEVAINFLRDKESCRQLNNNKSPTCTALMTFGTAGIAVCGETDYRLVCDSAAGFARGVFEDCRNIIDGDDKVGGVTLIRGRPGSEDYRGIMVYHT